MASERKPDAVSEREGPELGQTSRPYLPAKRLNTDYPLIDSDPHFSRVMRYARGSDYLHGTALAACGPALMLWWERISPSEASPKSFASIMRLSGVISASAGFYYFYSRSVARFYGFTENRREVDLDMKEMVAKVKKGEPLYGTSTMTEYMQGVASRQSRYAGVWIHVIPWFNFVNHAQHGVDTAKYYRQAERELEAERTGKAAS